MRLLILDRFQWTGDALARVLASEPDVEVVGVVTTAPDAMVRLAGCDTLLVSAVLPCETGTGVVRAACTMEPRVKTIVADLPYAPDAVFEYAQVGASAFGFEDDTIEELLLKMRAAHLDDALIYPRFALSRHPFSIASVTA